VRPRFLMQQRVFEDSNICPGWCYDLLYAFSLSQCKTLISVLASTHLRSYQFSPSEKNQSMPGHLVGPTLSGSQCRTLLYGHNGVD
jgi:hypothetical protein